MYIIAWIIVIGIVIAAVVPWKFSVKKYEDTGHPGACIDCNKGSCEGCLLEGLTAEQAQEQITELTQQAIADNTIAYGKRFQKEGKRG
jgi:hypothetical protein